MDPFEVKNLMSALEDIGRGNGLVTPTSSSLSNICKYWANDNCCIYGNECHNLHAWCDGISVHPKGDNPKKVTRLVWWTAPPENFVKINCDGAFSTFHGKKAAAGGVMRDCDGTFITGFSSQLMNCDSVVEAELRAIQIGMELALSMGFRNLIIESDSLIAVRLINNKVLRQDKPHATLISSIMYLANEAHSICWNHVFRETNSVADSFAKYGLSLSPYSFKLTAYPPKFSLRPLSMDQAGTIYSR